MLQIAKLTVGSLAAMTLFSCSKEPSAQILEEEPSTTEEKFVEPQQSPLEAQVMLMLEGYEGDQKTLRHSVETIEWNVILKTWKHQIKAYTAKHGKAPEKKNIVRVHSTLSMIQSELDLEDSTRRRKESLQNLEDTIKSAIEVERKKAR